MNKSYFIFPLIGLLIFGGFYLNFEKGYSAKVAEAAAKAEQAKKDKARQDIINREAAIKAAIEAQAKRKLEREERERVEEAKKTARQDAEDLRQRSYDDRNRLRDQVNRLKKDLEEVKAATAKVAAEKKKLTEEQGFLQAYVKQAEANVKYYYDLLDKITVAETARAAAEAAAAAAAKNR
jgi:small-conductance mechanosensitive channel